MKTNLCWLLFLCFICSPLVLAQKKENVSIKPTYIGKPTSVVQVPSIASRTKLVIADLSETKEMQDGRASKYNIIPGKGSKGDDLLAKRSHPLKSKIAGRSPNLVFETAASNGQPTDPAGAVGPNHYFAVTNTAFRIFDKNGNPLTELLPPNPTIFPNGGCCDLTASYDNVADRFVVTLLANSNGMHIAISNGPDPVNDSWTTYTYANVEDYSKLSVWWDGYYVTDNNTTSDKVHVFERDRMIAGDANAQIISFDLPDIATNGFFSPQALNISNNDYPTSGGATIIYLQDDAYSNVSEDHLKLWTIDMDWDTPSNSRISDPVKLGANEGVTPFVSVFDGGSYSNFTQPNDGEAIDALQAIIMNQAQFRKFTTHNSAVFNFVVDVDGSAAKQAGIRWYELRQSGDGQPWKVYQEGTYTAPDNRHAWNASLIMDIRGNIGMGYTSMSSPNSSDASVMVGSYYTGRYSHNPLGTMTLSEGVIMKGNANIPSSRYGDYSKIDVDPSNDKTFWFVNELMSNGRKNVCGVFQLAPNYANDVGIISINTPSTLGIFTNTETVTVSIFNYGENDVSNFPVSYSVDGGALVTETFTGTIASTTTAQYTFTQKADLSTKGKTYSITASTGLSNDEYNTNNSTTTSVKHRWNNDVGVVSIDAPVTGSLTNAETITVTLQNFGVLTQTNIPVSYTIDGGTPVNETYTGSIASDATDTYSFDTTADFSVPGEDYTIEASANLTTDSDTANNVSSTQILHQIIYCEPKATGGCNLDGIKRFVLGTIDADNGSNGCNNGYGEYPDGYENRTDLVTELTRNPTDNGNVHVLQAQHNWDEAPANREQLSVWIDFNNNAVFEDSERLISGESFTSAKELNDFTLTIPENAPLGKHVLRAKAIDVGKGGYILEPCSDFAFGEVQDYTVLITNSLNNEKTSLAARFRIMNLGDDRFKVKLPTSTFTDRLELKVYDILGQQIYWRSLYNEGKGYEHTINMSYVASGVYIIKLGNNQFNTSRKIIVE